MGLFNLKSLFGAQKGASSRKLDVKKRFLLLREAISGTMSKFYMAKDRESGQTVGLKILDSEKLKLLEARFKGIRRPPEGEIASKLDHPNIVKTLEYGTTTQNEQYLVMEFIEGPGLNSILIEQNEKMLRGIRVALIRQIAEALAYLHKSGYIHRDICPRNIMIEPVHGVLKLIDFGLTVPATPEFMQPGNRTGTPNYMAPELVKRQPTDQRLDVFSFGVTAYEILTYHLPWERGATGQVAMTHANQEPAPITRYRPTTNPRLADAISKCTEREVNKRCHSMEEFLRMIRNVDKEDGQ